MLKQRQRRREKERRDKDETMESTAKRGDEAGRKRQKWREREDNRGKGKAGRR